ncbi:two-component response regulator ARR12 isoform X1 [Vigna radiata var. radiata]|uniref:Two-component response regulator n=1 Tax=Vigna radiata var. radiata TaxID=3916 RepID=A0A3Q0F693_VIGRR|nr:two-component response regulator ARR12 isoform X1 [Vigna radiata var. radiata]
MVEEDHFPVGLRVLAVDDDRTYLTVLENLLRKCQYNVTATTQSVKALEMLRKNRNEFDLVISDVNMPEMDGFKLLQQVGLETDLPVIMLSGYGDRERVMKGVIYGACDFLTKPVRIQELQNIWQHVVRRKIDSKDKNKTASEEKDCSIACKFANEEEPCTVAGECSQALAPKTNADQNIKVDHKRKERCEVEEMEEDDKENDEPSNQKKSRLVWDTELHNKFLAAINQLEIDKAFPKKILDLMNIDGLSRENVASHLQKFRLGLKKPNPYHRMGSVDCFRTSSESGAMLSTTLPSYAYAPGGRFSVLNSPSCLNTRGMNSSAIVQASQSRNINSSSIKTHGNMHSSMFSANQTSSLLQGIPTSMEANHFKPNNSAAGIRRFNPLDHSAALKDFSSFSENIATVRNAANISLPGLSNNHLLFQGISQLKHHSEAFRNHSSFGAAAVKTQSFYPNSCGYSKMGDDYNNKRWQEAAPISTCPSNTSAVSNVFNNDQLLQHNFKLSSSNFCSRNSPVGFSSSVPLEDDVLGEMLHQEGLLGNILLASCYTKNNQGGCSKDTSQTFNSINPVISPNGGTSPLGHSYEQNSTVDNNRIDASLVGQMNGVNPSITMCSEGENFYSMKSNDAYVLQSMKSGEGLMQNSLESLDDILNGIDEQDLNAIMLMNEEL